MSAETPGVASDKKQNAEAPTPTTIRIPPFEKGGLGGIQTQLLTTHLEIWTTAETEKKSGRGRSSGNGTSVYGIKKLRELILELAVRGKLVPQDPNDEPADELLKRIQVEKARLMAEGKIKKDKPLPPISDEEKPFELPRGWQWVKLGNLCRLENGDRSKNYPNKSVLVEKGIPFVNAGHLENGRINRDEMTFITQERYDLLRSGKFFNDDILYCLRGSLGKSAIIKGFDTGAIASSLVIIRIYPYLNHHYFVDYFDSPLSFRMIKKYDNGTAQPNLSATDLEKFLIPLPPLPEQHRIVAKVDELMALCDQLETQHNNAAEAHEKLVNHLLGTLTQSQSADDFNVNWQRIAAHFDTLFTTEASIDALKQSLLQLAVMGKLTDSVPKKPSVYLQDLFNLIDGDRGPNYPKSHDYMEKGFCLFLSTKNVRKNGFLFDETQFITQEKHETLRQGLMKRGDIVITTRGTLGNIAVYDDSVPYDCVRINSGMLILRPKCSDVIPEFVMIFLQSPVFDNELQAKRSGSAQPQIPSGILKSFNLPLFNIEEQHRIVAKVDELMTLCDQLKSRITQASQLQKKLANVVVEQAIAS